MTVRQARELKPGDPIRVVAIIDDEIPEVIDVVQAHMGKSGLVVDAMDDMYLIGVALEDGASYAFSPEEIEA